MSQDDKEIMADLTLEELVDYVHSHDMGDYWEQMPEVHFDVKSTRGNISFLWTRNWLTKWLRLPSRSIRRPKS